MPDRNASEGIEAPKHLRPKIARRDDRGKIDNVAYLLNEANLKECFELLKKGKAAGIDGVGIEEYGQTLDENLKDLVARMKRQAYQAATSAEGRISPRPMGSCGPWVFPRPKTRWSRWE